MFFTFIAKIYPCEQGPTLWDFFINRSYIKNPNFLSLWQFQSNDVIKYEPLWLSLTKIVKNGQKIGGYDSFSLANLSCVYLPTSISANWISAPCNSSWCSTARSNSRTIFSSFWAMSAKDGWTSSCSLSLSFKSPRLLP